MIPYPPLNLPEFPARTRVSVTGTEIWDLQRQQFVLLTPEEWVRQHMINYLVAVLQYPSGLIAVEKQIRVLRTLKRFDIVVYDTALKPWMIIECKAYDLALNQLMIDQAARYNMTLQAPYLVVTNGMQYIVTRIDRETAVCTFLKEFPPLGP